MSKAQPAEPLFRLGEFPHKLFHFCEFQTYRKWAKIRYPDHPDGEFGWADVKKCKYCGAEK
jgi:hypothetical protein